MRTPVVVDEVGRQRHAVDEERRRLPARPTDLQHERLRLGRRREVDGVTVPLRPLGRERRARACNLRASQSMSSRVVETDAHLEHAATANPGGARVLRPGENCDTATPGVIGGSSCRCPRTDPRAKGVGAQFRNSLAPRHTCGGAEAVPARAEGFEAHADRVGRGKLANGANARGLGARCCMGRRMRPGGRTREPCGEQYGGGGKPETRAKVAAKAGAWTCFLVLAAADHAPCIGRSEPPRIPRMRDRELADSGGWALAHPSVRQKRGGYASAACACAAPAISSVTAAAAALVPRFSITGAPACIAQSTM